MAADPARLRDLFLAHPGRTATLSVLPIVLAGAQGLNALVHDVTSPLVAAFVVGMLLFAAVATRQSLAAFRVERLERGVVDEWESVRR